MDRHPLVEWIESLFAIHSHNCRYHDVFRSLRTELFMPISQLATPEKSLTDWLNQRSAWRRKADIAENVVLVYDYEDYYWLQEKDRELIRYDLEAEEQKDVATMGKESNTTRQLLQRLLLGYSQTAISIKTGLEAAAVFYHSLL